MNKLLVIIPARNEEKNIGKILGQVRADYGGVAVTTLTVNDGSTDKTAQLAKESGAFVLTNKKSLGVCLSVIRAFRWGIAKGFNYFVVIDADGQHIPDYISQVVEKLAEGFDLVSFSRFAPQSEVPYLPPTTEKFVINTMLAATVSRLSGVELTDGMCGFFGITAPAILKMKLGKDRGYGLTLELLIKAKMLGLRLVQLPHPCIYFEGYPTRFGQYYKTDNHLGERLASYVGTIVSVLEEGGWSK